MTTQETLPEGVAALRALVLAAWAERDAERAEKARLADQNDRLRHLIRQLQRLQFGRRSERLDPDQLNLALEDLQQAVAETQAEQEKTDLPTKRARAEQRRAGRGALPEHLPRIEVVVEPEDRACPGCGGAMHVIGEDRAQRLDVIPAQYRVIVTRRPKYACRGCQGAIVQAPAPARLIEGGLPTEQLVAQVVVAKYADHCPLYRQSQILARQGIDIDRATLAFWVGYAAAELKPLWRLLREAVLRSAKLFVDETTAPVLDPGRGRTKKGYFWAIARDDRPWQGTAPPAVVYNCGPGSEIRPFVTPTVVKQRLKLTAVSPRLLDLYAEDELTLEQLMAFTVTSDHARQEQVWEALSRSYSKEAYSIRRQLIESTVHASDKRAQFVGTEAYEAAGGAIMRDLFEDDEGGWLQDPALLDRLVAEKLAREAEKLREEGWKWIEAAVDLPYGHSTGLRRLMGEAASFTEEEQAVRDALRAELGELENTYAEAPEYPDEVDARLGEIEAALQEFDERPAVYDPSEIARAGIFVSVDRDGTLRVARAYVRPEDEPPVSGAADDGGTDDEEPAAGARWTVITVGGAEVPDATGEPEDDDGIKPLPDRLVTELTCHRTLALRDALPNDPDIALLGVLHALCLQRFYFRGSASCLEVTAKSAGFSAQAPGLSDGATAKAIEERHERWEQQLPEDPAELWEKLASFDADSRAVLMAHCVSLSVNAVHEPWSRGGDRIAHADQLALALGLDMAAAGWTPTVDNYLGRVTKARILEAVREAKGDASTQLIDHLKKPDMAREAERLLAGTGWLPEPLRAQAAGSEGDVPPDGEATDLPTFLAGNENGDPDLSRPHDLAAE